MANNVFGIFFSIQGIESLSLGSYFNGVILLCGLFVYDVFWVFGTDVMVTVAKSFDAPIKLLFPRNIGASPPSMLGLGDIVIPGIFVALVLRFDHSLNQAHDKGRVKQWHFAFVLSGYVLGLVSTIVMMVYFNTAQPALLYLVPTCLGTSFLAGALSGHLRAMVNFTEKDLHSADSKAEPGSAASFASNITPSQQVSASESSSPLSPSSASGAKRRRSKKME